MTAPAFGSNTVGGSAAPCPLGNLKVQVKHRADGKAPTCDLTLVLSGHKMMEAPLSAGTNAVEFQHLPPGPYTVRIEADEPFIGQYEVPDPVRKEVPKSTTVQAEVLLDRFARVEIQVGRTDKKAVGGEVTVKLRRKQDVDAPAGAAMTTTNLKAVFEKVRSGPYEVTVELPPELEPRFATPLPIAAVSVAAGTNPIKASIDLVPLPWVILKVVASDGAKVEAIEAALKDPGGKSVRAGAAAAFVEVNAEAAGTANFQVESLDANPARPDEIWELVDVDAKA